MMRQMNSWVPIAPLPSPLHPAALAAASASSPRGFDWDRLGENDVLLRKGGRPTHGKVRYFRFLQGRANEYASYKSPIDRRLLARELVDNWLSQGGRFCRAVATGGASPSSSSTTHVGDSSIVFRVASTEEALQFTRRVLVRHFTPTIHKRTRNLSRKVLGPTSDARASASPTSVQQTLASAPAENMQATGGAVDGRAALVDLESATNEAADALCCLRSTARVRESSIRLSGKGGEGGLPPVDAPTALASLATPQTLPARVSPTNHP